MKTLVVVNSTLKSRLSCRFWQTDRRPSLVYKPLWMSTLKQISVSFVLNPGDSSLAHPGFTPTAAPPVLSWLLLDYMSVTHVQHFRARLERLGLLGREAILDLLVHPESRVFQVQQAKKEQRCHSLK